MSRLSKLKEWIKARWVALMAYFRDSEVIFLARVQMVFGFIFAVLGSLDLAHIFFAYSTPKEQITAGVVLFIQGSILEIARRMRDKEDEAKE